MPPQFKEGDITTIFTYFDEKLDAFSKTLSDKIEAHNKILIDTRLNYADLNRRVITLEAQQITMEKNIKDLQDGVCFNKDAQTSNFKTTIGWILIIIGILASFLMEAIRFMSGA